MADIAQVIATYDALVGVALGAGLTYGFGALNRRHIEKRESETRWYEARFKTYSEYSRAVSSKVLFPANTSPTREERAGLREEFASLLADIRLVGSVNVVEKAEKVFWTTAEELEKERLVVDRGRLLDKLYDFEVEARRDLGYDTGYLEPDPTPRSKDLGHPSP